ncbi:MAG: helix-turn-helix transcriptional regulator [Lachnospiraceae bacterium]|nr:helix-turn-helix transcriptional regulator [Lachnospiraceae bacterium]
MLNENLKILRKNKGYSQEQLAVRLNVVRQTVSKWEKGLSVPDAQMLMDIAEVFSVSVNELIGNDIEQETKTDTLEVIAQELAKLNELMAIEQQKKEETKKKIVEVIGIILFILFIASIFDEWNQIWYEFGQNIYKLTH